MQKNFKLKLLLLLVVASSVWLLLRFYFPYQKLKFESSSDEIEHVVISNFDRWTQKYHISIESEGSSSVAKPQMFHAGWIRRKLNLSEFGAHIKVNGLEAKDGACDAAPVFNRVGLGLILQNKNIKKDDERYFVFFGVATGFWLNRLNIKTKSLVSLVMKCRNECIILDEYISSEKERPTFQHLKSKIYLGGEIDLNLKYDRKLSEIQFFENKIVWERVKILPLLNDPKFNVWTAKIDIAHFVPPCLGEQVSLKTDVEFSQVKLINFDKKK